MLELFTQRERLKALRTKLYPLKKKAEELPTASPANTRLLALRLEHKRLLAAMRDVRPPAAAPELLDALRAASEKRREAHQVYMAALNALSAAKAEEVAAKAVVDARPVDDTLDRLKPLRLEYSRVTEALHEVKAEGFDWKSKRKALIDGFDRLHESGNLVGPEHVQGRVVPEETIAAMESQMASLESELAQVLNSDAPPAIATTEENKINISSAGDSLSLAAPPV